MFSDVVMEIDKSLFEEEIDKMKAEKQVKLDTDLTTEDLKRISKKIQKYIKKNWTRLPRRPIHTINRSSKSSIQVME